MYRQKTKMDTQTMRHSLSIFFSFHGIKFVHFTCNFLTISFNLHSNYSYCCHGNNVSIPPQVVAEFQYIVNTTHHVESAPKKGVV